MKRSFVEFLKQISDPSNVKWSQISERPLIQTDIRFALRRINNLCIPKLPIRDLLDNTVAKFLSKMSAHLRFKSRNSFIDNCLFFIESICLEKEHVLIVFKVLNVSETIYDCLRLICDTS